MTLSKQATINRLRAAGCVFAEAEAKMFIAEAATVQQLDDMISRRESGTPLEYIIGWAEFCGQKILVEPGVFVPRHRTEFLVELAAALTKPYDTVVDMCCGSGALAKILASEVQHIKLYATDIDPVATACARSNLCFTGAVISNGNLFEALSKDVYGQINILMANVPYVPTNQIELLPREARLYEHHVTLDGGSDGLDIFRAIVEQASDWLAFGGYTLSEISDNQADAAAEIMIAAGLHASIEQSADHYTTVIVGSKS